MAHHRLFLINLHVPSNFKLDLTFVLSLAQSEDTPGSVLNKLIVIGM